MTKKMTDAKQPLEAHLSFEEALAEFLLEGNSLINTARPLRNLIGESSTWRQDDWSTKAGKSLPRTPVDQPRLYPNLSTITEIIESTYDEVAFSFSLLKNPILFSFSCKMRLILILIII